MNCVPSAPPHAEAAALQTLAICSPPLNADLHAELKDIFDICRPAWVADFLFNQSMTSLPTLTAPHNMAAAVSCSLSMSNVQCSPQAQHEFDTQLTASFIFVPAFSVGSVSVGFGVQEGDVSCHFGWNHGRVGARRTHMRFVRDDASGILVLIEHLPLSDSYIVDYMAPCGVASRRRVYAAFDADVLRRAAYSTRGTLPVDEVMAGLQTRKSLVERRPCPVCGVGRNATCACVFVRQRPAHPLDFGQLGRNMMSYAGAYEGLADAGVFADGVEVFSGKVGSQIEINGGVDNELISRLRRWAITDQLKDRKENPFASAMPLGGRTEAERDGGKSTIDIVQGGGSADCCVHAVGMAWPDLTSVTEDVERTHCQSSLLAPTSLDNNEDMGALQTVSVPFVDQSIATPRREAEGRRLRAVYEIAGALESEAPGFPGDMDAVEELPYDCVKNASLAASDVMGDSSARPAVAIEPTISGVSQKGAPMQIAPAVPAPDAADEEMGEKEKRAQLRKQRNREAAQRSNMKRKERNDSLKNALKEVHARAAELRVQELHLREENLRLRKLAPS